jgi:hypothetical protein
MQIAALKGHSKVCLACRELVCPFRAFVIGALDSEGDALGYYGFSLSGWHLPQYS